MEVSLCLPVFAVSPLNSKSTGESDATERVGGTARLLVHLT